MKTHEKLVKEFKLRVRDIIEGFDESVLPEVTSDFESFVDLIEDDETLTRSEKEQIIKEELSLSKRWKKEL